MRLSKENIDARIVELYKSGWSYRAIQKRYHKPPNHIAKLVKGIEVVCTGCGKRKGKTRFHAHHPDRINHPDHTLPYCPSCHAKEEARLRREKENKPQSPSLVNKSGIALVKPQNAISQLSMSSPTFSYAPISPKAKKVLAYTGIAVLVEVFFPGFFKRRWQEIQDHWHKS